MPHLSVVGIGIGNPEHLTLEAVRALRDADVLFAVDKGDGRDGLMAVRKAVCDRALGDRPYRLVAIPEVPRDRAPKDYDAAVREWHAARAEAYADAFAREIGEGARGAFLVWGDPALYDSTLRILDRIADQGRIPLTYEVLPGISSVQLLAARHRTVLNGIGEAVHVTTGRRLLKRPEAAQSGSTVVMLDGAPEAVFAALDPDLAIYWGAYLGSADEMLVAGRLGDVASEILRLRRTGRAQHGWIMDIYLLRGVSELA
ncbi:MULTISPECIES: precorrin-6A synthase (deacetylating) [Methylobacterium]|uniref:Precorrin-6A synthase [deacetylating] n=4 Tax=Pseudomonadota TaxID=1224 RepID=A0ABQ4STK8_9HYPH|nr:MULTISPECIES: precorrin-6A synthase (deacetylating) [Methylobacterium]PIU07556.1 MAG: precorrin-6A synthase (deacetylating) [Methylobacterium sp. CG09_land_8_20_14_0_10_71_15]PIU13343.1 MAG: precorrin-6A synthase (deacetylating) [Methylobacterium sp. CG08_land_8_20_14_0_20_71_15]GBU17743.1 putative tetrapyrrole methylase family protein [Methylobacterium sp.]GJE06427.1 hypothetical protein AOPFMNJM_1745 [Methylobacterium jeotgali]